MYCWHGAKQAEHNYYWSVVKSYTLVFFFLLRRYLHCCWWAGNDPDTTWHFLVWHYAGLNEQLPYSLSTECTADEQTPLQAGLGRWGKGECHYWNYLPFPTTHSQCSLPSPGTWHSAVKLLWELGAGVLWPYRGTVSFWHGKGALLPDPQPQNHRQITATTLRLSVLWLGGISRRRWYKGFGFKTLENTDNTNFWLDISLPSLHVGFLCISIPPLSTLHVIGLTVKEQVILTFNFH